MASSRKLGKPSVTARYTFRSMWVISSFFLLGTLANPHFEQIDSIDPAFAPATGTPETGGTSFFLSRSFRDSNRIALSHSLVLIWMHVPGWSTRELRTILRGLDGLHIVSADIVEVAPAYDTNAELTTMAAADVSPPPPPRPKKKSDARRDVGLVRGDQRHGKDPARQSCRLISCAIPFFS